MTFLLTLILSACGSTSKVGINEISLKELEKKFDNKETFLLLAYAENQDDIDRTNFIKAYDQALKDYNLKAYFINMIDMDEDELEVLENKYEHPDSRGGWSPSYAELTLVVDGLAGLENGYDHKNKDWLNDGKDYLKEMDNINSGIKDILAYLSAHNIEIK